MSGSIITDLQYKISKLEEEKEILQMMFESSMANTKSWVKKFNELEKQLKQEVIMKKDLEERIEKVTKECGVKWINEILMGDATVKPLLKRSEVNED
jgi:hypothetical protein